MNECFKYFSDGKHSAPQVFSTRAINGAVNSLAQHAQNNHNLFQNFFDKIDSQLAKDIIHDLYKGECGKPKGLHSNGVSVSALQKKS